MTNRTTLVLITVLMALALGAGAGWLTGSLRTVPFLAIGMGLFVLALVGYFTWRIRFQRRILGDADNRRRAA